jgi:hypothetical protein
MSVVHSWRSAGAGNHLQHVDLVQLRLSWGVGVRGGTPDIWTGPRASLTSHTINNNATRRKRRMLVMPHSCLCGHVLLGPRSDKRCVTVMCGQIVPDQGTRLGLMYSTCMCNADFSI